MRAVRITCALACLAALTGSAPASAADDVQKITPNDIGTRFAPANTTGSFAFGEGPATAPLGRGSVTLYTADGSQKVNLFTAEQADTPLADIDALAYSTYRHAADPGSSEFQVGALNMGVDIDGDGDWDTTLVFEPVYNTGQGAVTSGVWQDWDAYDGGNAIWWSSAPIPGAPDRDTFVPWSTIVALNPDAEVVYYGINQGSGNADLRTSFDALEIGTDGADDTVYDFEPLTGPPTSKDQCKDGGWKAFDNPSFKNQGDCVSYVAKRK